MNILIDNLFLQTGAQKETFVESAKATGHQVCVSEYVRNIKSFEHWIPRRQEYIVYGSIQFVEDALREFPQAMAFYNTRMFNCSYFMSYLPAGMFVNHDAEFFPVGFLRNIRAARLHYRQSCTSEHESYFLRSDSGRKLFAGKPMKLKDLHSFDAESLSEDSFVMMSTIKSIGTECRYFIYNNTIVSSCPTHMNARLVERNLDLGSQLTYAMDKFAQRVAGMVHDLGFMDKIYVCDIATYRECGSSQENIGIMEFNAASTSDMHYCDITKVFNAMIDCIEKENGCD